MPKAFLLEEGLDWDTIAESFWAWLREAHRIEAGDKADDLVEHMVESQRPRIDAFLAQIEGGEQERFVLYTALATLGAQYAAMEKLASGLRKKGVLEREG